MTYKETEDWLKRCWHAETMYNLRLREHYEMKADMERMTASLSGMPGSPSKDPHKFDKLVIKWEAINKEFERLMKVKEEVRDAIIKLEGVNEQQVLSIRFLQTNAGRPYTWDTIGGMMDYSGRQVYRIYKQAVQHLSEII